MQITVNAAINILPELAATLGTHIEESLDHGIVTAWEVADQFTPVDTGALRGNVVVNKSPGRREMIWNQHYAIYVEFGTGRGVKAHLFATQGADAGMEAVETSLARWVP